VTFGSFNNIAKINSKVIAVWARLLRGVPGSRLVIKNPSLSEQVTRERYRALFAAEGIAGERLDLLGMVPDDRAHLAAYERIDIALDTFPYNGATTTCEALWMGVPVVTLRGGRHSARVGASLLTAAGFPEWIADSVDEYVQIASTLASDSAALVQRHAQLRNRVAQSRLCAGESYARDIEAALDEMYRERASFA
jgi:predicted O-linked N-acetylglucosamine transferase (SPINDLY family)